MLLLLVFVLLLFSIAFLFVKKSKNYFLLVGVYFSLFILFAAVMIFIAKKGGYSREILNFLFFSDRLRFKLQYLFITLRQLGYLLAIGRYLFPLFFLEMALYYAVPDDRKLRRRLMFAAVLLPILSLIIYFPPLYFFIIDHIPYSQKILVQLSYYWLLAYVVIALILYVKELISISIPYLKRRFLFIVLEMCSLAGLYILYCGQDPGQVYRFYSSDYSWIKGIGYMQYAATVEGYTIIVVINVLCFALAVLALIDYTKQNLSENRDNFILDRKFSAASFGASIFSHSIKNQLLSNRVLYKRLDLLLTEEKPDVDQKAKIQKYLEMLKENNEFVLQRSEELYKAAKFNKIHLKIIDLLDVLQESEERLLRKYPQVKLRIEVDQNYKILADQTYLAEAIYNLLTNAWEANLMVDKEEEDIVLKAEVLRKYVIISIQDQGAGIHLKDAKKIFDPFYSTKNPTQNWGLGLYYVRKILKSHMGSVQLESKADQGSSFYLFLPRLNGRLQKNKEEEGNDKRGKQWQK